MVKILSFIVPVYKCEPYLVSCLESIYGAGVREDDFEVILVNDGSPDNSAEICRRWASSHGNIVYVEQENQGASTARNTGMRAARGEWLWFVDSDDEVVPEFFATIMPRLVDDTETELFFFNYREVYADHSATVRKVEAEEAMSGLDYLERFSDGYLWNKLYRRSSLKHTFLDGTKNIEDAYFNMRNVPAMQHVRTLAAEGYRYARVNPNSTQFNPSYESKLKLSDDTLTIQRHILDDLEGVSSPRLQAVLRRKLTEITAGHLNSMLIDYPVGRLKYVVGLYRRWGLYPVREKTGTRKMRFFIAVANHYWLLLLIARLGIFRRRKC